MPQTSRDQFNQLIQRLLSFTMNKNLIGQRQSGYESLQSQRSADTMKRLQVEFENEISKLEPIQNLQAQVQQGRALGRDVSLLERQLEDEIGRVAKAAFTVAGGQPWTQEVAEIVASLSKETFRSFVGQGATTYRQEQQISRVAEPGLALREKEFGISERQAGVSERKITLEEADVGVEGTKETRGIWEDRVSASMEFLIGQGVKAEEVSKGRMAGWIVESGKTLSPMAPENQGKALFVLSQLMNKIARPGYVPTATEQNFISQVYNVAQVEKAPEAGGGLPSPETGLTATGETELNTRADTLLNQRLLQLMTESYKKQGFSDENALYKAQKLLESLFPTKEPEVIERIR